MHGFRSDQKSWDWQTGIKIIPLNKWSKGFNCTGEFHVSDDGEKIASVLKLSGGKYDVCVNGKNWRKPLDKIWCLRFAPDGRLTALVSEEDFWTVSVDGQVWETKFSYVWNTIFVYPDL